MRNGISNFSGNISGQPIAVPTGHRRLQLVCSDGAAIPVPHGARAPIRLRGRLPFGDEAGDGMPALAWEAQLTPIIRRVIRAMSEAHPSTLIEELLGPLRAMRLEGLPDNADDLVTRIAQEIIVALPHLAADPVDMRKVALRWLGRMESNAREPARQQYRELLSLLG